MKAYNTTYPTYERKKGTVAPFDGSKGPFLFRGWPNYENALIKAKTPEAEGLPHPIRL